MIISIYFAFRQCFCSNSISRYFKSHIIKLLYETCFLSVELVPLKNTGNIQKVTVRNSIYMLHQHHICSEASA